MQRTIVLAALAAGLSAVVATAQTSVPVPSPFPGAGAPPAGQAPRRPATPQSPAPAPPAGSSQAPAAPATTTAPAAPATTPAPAGPAAPALPGVPLYPSAEFIATYDAGSGQSYHLYGTNLPYADAVAYYRTVLKNGGREIYRSPGIHQFDLGRFDEDRMAYPPSVVVKDYAANNSPGYLAVDGTNEKRFRTVIQIVAPAP